MQIGSALDLGHAIRSERTRLGFSQEALAAAAGVGARFVVELEQGKASAELDKALAVTRAVGLTITAASSESTDA